MQIFTTVVNNVSLLSVEGRVDGATAQGVQDRVGSVVESGARKIVLNLAKVEYISSAGLRAILISAKAITAASGELRICNLHGMVRDVFDISGISNVLSVFDSETDALKGF
ncbi:MAG: STAS domain-containing protein [Pseudomonadota bacterium]